MSQKGRHFIDMSKASVCGGCKPYETALCYPCKYVSQEAKKVLVWEAMKKGIHILLSVDSHYHLKLLYLQIVSDNYTLCEMGPLINQRRLHS